MTTMFADRLRELRQGADLTQKSVSELCGLSHDAIGKYERGERIPSLETLQTIAAFFGVSLDDLTGNKNFSKPPVGGQESEKV